jgi:hypothetical protein
VAATATERTIAANPDIVIARSILLATTLAASVSADAQSRVFAQAPSARGGGP